MKAHHLEFNNISGYSSYVQEADDYIDSDVQIQMQCNFCTGININRCLMISVQNKHNEQPNRYLQRIQKIVFPSKSASSLLTKYEQLLKNIDRQEKMVDYFRLEKTDDQIKDMVEYYKFRKFVPLFADDQLAETLHSYYYEKLKIHYNQVKKRLNITIDPTQETQLSFYDSQAFSKSNVFMKSKILIDLINSTQAKEQIPSQHVGFHQTQSKALDDLLKVLVSNQKFKSIKALNVMNEWEKTKKTSKQMFRDHILDKKKRSSQFVKKINNKILITFFSRDVKSGHQTKFQNTYSKPQLLADKVVKSKDLKFLLKDKDKKIMTKFQKIKKQVLHQQNQSSKRQLNSQKKRSSKKGLISQNVMPSISKLQYQEQSNHKNYNKKQMNPCLKKINFKTDIQKNQLFNKISSKLVFKSPKPTKQSPYQSNFLSIHKVERSKSQMKLKRQQRNIRKDIKNKDLLPNQPSSMIKTRKKDSLEKLQKVKDQTLQKVRNRRKSLDLTKLKTTLTSSQHHTKLKQDSTRKQQMNLPHKYKILDEYQKNKIQNNMIKTTNVSPTNRKSQNQFKIQKEDNIVSIKKKKIQMLKKRMESQRKGITQFK